jgi:YegS/Rv2252/BmrU family lipid kinase
VSGELRTLPESAREVLISVNPNAGWRNNREIVQQLVTRLQALDITSTVHDNIDELSAQAAELHTAGRLRSVVAAGGDGTIALVAQRTTQGMPLAILPLGTENVLSKYLGLPANPQPLAKVIAAGQVVALDAGLANGRLFTLMVGCGFDAEVVRRLHSRRRGQIHHWSYLQPIWDTVRHYSYPKLTVYYKHWDESNGEWRERSVSGRWVFVVNLPRYAGGLNLAPQANGVDGLLDVCVFEEGSLWNGLWYLGRVLLGSHTSLTGVHTLQAAAVRIEAEGPVPFQCDGDPGGELPVQVEISPERLTLLVDETWAKRQSLRIASRSTL